VETAASRVRAALAPGVVQCRCGFGGHLYVFSCSREAVERVARSLGRSGGVYYRSDLDVWALRIRRDQDKQAVRSLVGSALKTVGRMARPPGV